MPVPGTTTPEPEPSEHESDAALPSASTTEMCVVIDGASTQAAREPAAIQLRREQLVARRVLRAHRLDDRRATPKLPRRSSCCRPYAISTPPDDGGGFDAKLVAAERRGHRPARDDAVAGEVVPARSEARPRCSARAASPS